MVTTITRLLLAAAAVALPAAATAQEAPPPPPAAAAPVETGGRLFAILLEPGPAWQPGKPFEEQGLGPHLAYWVALHRAGRIVTAGPLGDDSGLVLFYAAAEGEAEAVLKGDPAVGAGIFVGTVRPYAPPMVNTARLASERD